MSRTEVYCPACGEVSEVCEGGLSRFAPGAVEIQCPLCKTRFRVVIEFHEIEGGEE